MQRSLIIEPEDRDAGTSKTRCTAKPEEDRFHKISEIVFPRDYCSEFACQSCQTRSILINFANCANQKISNLHKIRAERSNESLFLRFDSLVASPREENRKQHKV